MKRTTVCQPDFLQTKEGSLFLLQAFPANTDVEEVVLCVPPFAEEMNKSRKMMRLLLQGVAEQGKAGILFDLFGTGDSQGDFSDASWAIWLANLQAILANIQQRFPTSRISVIALRTGALLLNDCLNQECDAGKQLPIKAIHYWNPVFNAKQFVTQFLRLKLAADMMGEGGEKLSAKQLRGKVTEHGQLEVAGYLAKSSLIEGLEQAKIALPQGMSELSLYFYELSTLGKLTPALERQLPQVAGDYSVTTFAMASPQFWATQEISLCEPLLADTLAKLGGK